MEDGEVADSENISIAPMVGFSAPPLRISSTMNTRIPVRIARESVSQTGCRQAASHLPLEDSEQFLDFEWNEYPPAFSRAQVTAEGVTLQLK